MEDKGYRLWELWRDKYGYEGAIEEYYPDLLEDNREIVLALAQIRIGKRAIDSIFRDLEEEEAYDESS